MAEAQALDRADIEAILERYDTGRLVGYSVLPLGNHNSPYYRVQTARTSLFLKRYRTFTANVTFGLEAPQARERV